MLGHAPFNGGRRVYSLTTAVGQANNSFLHTTAVRQANSSSLHTTAVRQANNSSLHTTAVRQANNSSLLHTTAVRQANNSSQLHKFITEWQSLGHRRRCDYRKYLDTKFGKIFIVVRCARGCINRKKAMKSLKMSPYYYPLNITTSTIH